MIDKYLYHTLVLEVLDVLVGGIPIKGSIPGAANIGYGGNAGIIPPIIGGIIIGFKGGILELGNVVDDDGTIDDAVFVVGCSSVDA